MTYKFTVNLNADQTDEITLNSLKEAYEDCIETIVTPAMQAFDPLEDVIPRQQALMKVLEYYSVPQEYQKYIKYWDNYINDTLKTGKKADEKTKDSGDDK